VIKSITIKNFLSFGNKPIEFTFDQGTTLIVGENGSGKSTIYDAVYFALFGSSFRDTKKASLTNEKNGKNLEVKLTLSDYIITRTSDSVSVTHKGSDWPVQTLKEMQERIEAEIIKCNSAYVKQTMILGSDLHVPFFKLPALDRRRVLESLVNLNEVSIVENKVKKKLSDVKKLVEANQTEITALSQRLESVKRADTHNQTIESKKVQIQLEVKSKAVEAKKLLDSVQVVEGSDFDSQLSHNHTEIGKLQGQLTSIQKVKAGLSVGACTSCLQKITDAHKAKILPKLDSQIADITSTIEGKSELVQALRLNKSIHDKNESIQRQVKELNSAVQYLLKSKSSLELVSVDECNLNEISDSLNKVQDEYQENKKVLDACQKVLDVIRSGTIRQTMMQGVVKKIQAKISANLIACGFKGLLAFDVDGTETITYRGKERSYGQHSAGERARIDLAVMLAMRSYSIQHGSANLGILVLDEIADSSLDYDGLNGILSTLEDDPQCVIIVSHHPGSLLESANRVVTVKKDSMGFSQLEIA
jgi:exonuclease SbcC